MPKKLIDHVKSGPQSCSGPPRSTTCTRSLRFEGLESWKSHQIGIYALKNYFWGQIRYTELFMSTQINNMCPFYVVWGTRKLRITPDWYLCPKKSINHVKSGARSCSGPRSTTCTRSLQFEGLERTGTCCWSGWPWTTRWTWFDITIDFFGQKCPSGVIFSSLAPHITEI